MSNFHYNFQLQEFISENIYDTVSFRFKNQISLKNMYYIVVSDIIAINGTKQKSIIFY